MSGAVTLQKVGRVAKIMFNQPSKLNAMTADMVADFGNIVESLKMDTSDVGAVVIYGAGRAFSAGGDLGFLRDRMKDEPSRNSVIMHKFYNQFLCIRDLPIPTIAAINGPAIGAGLCLAMACDVRIAAKDAKLGFTFVGLGLHPGMGCTHFVASVAGYETAYRMILSGDIVTGAEAKEMRLVSQCAESGDQAIDEAINLGNRISEQAPIAVRAATRSLRMKQDVGLEQALWREADAQSYSYNSSDMQEGVDALIGRRPAEFKLFEDYNP